MGDIYRTLESYIPSLDHRSDFQRALLAVHLQKICIPLLYALGIFTTLYLLFIGQLGLLVLPDDQWQFFNYWRLTISALMIWMVLAITLSRNFRRSYHYAFTLAYIPAVFFSGFYLSNVTAADYSVMYILYLVPFFTLVLPGNLMERALATAAALLILPGAFLSRGWTPSFFLGSGLVITSCIIISTVVGHYGMYRLNRINFFQSRELEQTKNRIQELAMFDQLTGLYERHEIEKRLQEQYSQAQRQETSFSVLMIDLDHFKDVNDTYGHDMGDKVLEYFGQTIDEISENHLRESDVAGRFGGEEFCIMLPTADQGGAVNVADRIRKKLREKTFQSDNGETFQVTCSIGAAELGPDVHDPEDLIKRADEALYEAKESGRDQVRLYQELQDQEN